MRNPFERWHPKVALRYLPIVAAIKKGGLKNPSILEVGSGSLGIAPYLKMPVTGVDQDFSGPTFPLLKKVVGKATAVPFPDKSFDFVVMVDVLEHLPPKERPKAIEEALRCAQREVFIAVPCGKLAWQQDQELDRYFRQVFGKPFPFLAEHLKYGLPEKEAITAIIKTGVQDLNLRVEIKTFGSLNLSFRKFLMRGWMTKNKLVDFIFRKFFLLFIPIFRLINFEPTYRQLFFIKIKGSQTAK